MQKLCKSYTKAIHQKLYNSYTKDIQNEYDVFGFNNKIHVNKLGKVSRYNVGYQTQSQ